MLAFNKSDFDLGERVGGKNMENLLCHLLISQVSQFEDNTVRIFDLIGMIYQRIAE